MFPKFELESGKAGEYPRPVFHRKFLLFTRLVTSILAESPGRGQTSWHLETLLMYRGNPHLTTSITIKVSAIHPSQEFSNVSAKNPSH